MQGSRQHAEMTRALEKTVVLCCFSDFLGKKGKKAFTWQQVTVSI
jgi:hypothetical protein